MTWQPNYKPSATKLHTLKIRNLNSRSKISFINSFRRWFSSKMLGTRTEPATVWLNASVGQLIGLKLVLQNLAFTIALWPRIVHLEAANRRRASTTAFSIRTIRVQRVFRLARYVHFLLFRLRHFRSPVSSGGGVRQTAKSIATFRSRTEGGANLGIRGFGVFPWVLIKIY